MKRISRWAAAHPLRARFLVLLLQLVLILSALVGGCFLFVMEDFIPSWLVSIFAVIFLMALVFYPSKKEKKVWGEKFYSKQKSHDFILVVACFVVLMLGCQGYLKNSAVQPAYAQFTTNTIPTSHLDFKDLSSKKAKRKSFKTFRKNLKQLKKDWKQHKSSKRTWIGVLLTVLVLLVILGLGALVAALSCSVSCNGMGGLAIVILVLGWGALIGLGIWVVKKIIKKDWSKPTSNP